MHLFKNNVVPLVLGVFVIVGKISIKEVTTHLLWSSHITLTKEGLPPRIPCMQAKSPIQGKQPWWIGGWHMDIPRIEGSTRRQAASKPSEHQGPTLGTTGQTPRESTCRGGLNRPCVSSSWPSTWCFLVGSWSTLGVLKPFSRSCSRPINRMGGDSFLTQLTFQLLSHFWFPRLGGRLE
jgi:hypothetical protein